MNNATCFIKYRPLDWNEMIIHWSGIEKWQDVYSIIVVIACQFSYEHKNDYCDLHETDDYIWIARIST